MDPLSVLDALPAVGGHPMASRALDLLPVSASIVSAIRDDAGTVTDFRIEYSNQAASASSPDRTEAYGQALFDIIPAFRDVGLFDRYVEVLEGGSPYTEEGVRLRGTYGDLEYDVRVDVVAIRLDADHILSVSHDRTSEHNTSVRLANVQETLGRRERMERQINAVNAGLVEDLLGVQLALDRNDLVEARRRSLDGARRAAEVVTGLRDVIRTGP